ncbi:transposase remnant [Streptomyces lividans TK24]|nr:transposase remnant [Streptomyces lividans TK24]
MAASRPPRHRATARAPRHRAGPLPDVVERTIAWLHVLRRPRIRRNDATTSTRPPSDSPSARSLTATSNGVAGNSKRPGQGSGTQVAHPGEDGGAVVLHR